jgi:hypothetical protein
MDQETFQQLVGGETVTVAIKNLTAQKITPQSQLLACGNKHTNYKENSGQYSRRCFEFTFKEAVHARDKDAMLKDRLFGELPMWIVKANRAYQCMFHATGGRAGDLWGTCKYDGATGGMNVPQYFHLAKQRMSEETNIMKRFLGESTDLIFGPAVYITEDALRAKFNTYTKNIGIRPQPRWEVKMFEQAIKERGIKLVKDTVKPWTDEPGAPHPDWRDNRDNYFEGVSVSMDKGGWFTRGADPHAADMDAAGGDLDAPGDDDDGRWYAALHDIEQSTKGPIADDVLYKIFKLHAERDGVVPKRVLELLAASSKPRKRARATSTAE